MSRLDDIRRFYEVLSRLEERVGGKRLLRHFSLYRDWPHRGVYFFFESRESRSESGEGPRVVRIGTHALSNGSRSTLRQRLGQHRGSTAGGGNHRGSIFRLLLGEAMIAKGDVARCPSWGIGSDLTMAAKVLRMDREELRDGERPVEEAVSRYVGEMPFLWLAVCDEPSPDSLRSYVERNAIALLSNRGRSPLDLPSSAWLGQCSSRKRVVESGLWNQRHVTETHQPGFVAKLSDIIDGAVE